jgi:hypothetical protein
MTARDDGPGRSPKPQEPETTANRIARLVDAEAMAAMLDVPSSWLLAQARRDAVPHVRLGRYVRFARPTSWPGRAQGREARVPIYRETTN